jgi:opacity protein-like surface antigen
MGAAKTRLKFTTFENENGADDPLIDDSTWGFAYQLIAGLSIPLTRQLSMGLEYHYWQAPWLNLEDLAGNDIDGRQTVHSGWLRLNYQPGGRVWTLPETDDRPVTASQGLYLSASAGAGWGVDRDLQGRDGQLDAFAVGSMSSFALGYGFGRHWRAELEFSRRQNEMQIFDTLYEEFRTTGDVRADSLALNLAYQFRPGTAINPYLGAGIGSSRLHYDLDFAGDRTPFVDDVDNAQMIQLLLGVDIALNGHWTLTTDYRLWVSEEVEVELLDSDETLKMSHAIHSWAVGLRYSFAD